MAKAIVLGIIYLAIFAAICLIPSFIIMVLSGAIGHAFNQPAFFISFWQAFLITLALSVIGGFFKGSSN